MDRIKLTLPADQKYVILARLTIASLANNMGFSIGDVEDLKVALTEACTNAISHNTDPEATYELSFFVGIKELTITVTDKGLGFEPDTVKLPGESDDPAGSGFGLFIIKTLMDTVEITSKKGLGTTITMVKTLPVDK
ncbi:ATP-binding protein [Acetobacterium bakii]|uniref:Histidine kinase n=1 Tax=Acetobacterium bakii TaxID=52689 RepID=A0A0L6TYL5_9FIRM|nr:ATP-binding protein [Acetobacterium bakii]KNZ41341.1 histidine kinase [Acetobacterium bakii]